MMKKEPLESAAWSVLKLMRFGLRWCADVSTARHYHKAHARPLD